MSQFVMEPTTEQLNALTNAGIISDNAVRWSDVAPCDQEPALAWLEQNWKKSGSTWRT